ncbi:MAG: alpha/beta hydrolase [Rhodobacteraceae bacterium]|nr:alpha/beta hydrolase [Paracoccaceae bacterium]
MSDSDYNVLLDAEIHGYLAYNASFMPDDPSLENIRKAYLAFSLESRPPLPEISFVDAEIAGVPTRRYAGKTPSALVVYFHGGGFVIGNLESHHAICMEMCEKTGLDVLAVDYRLAPEHPWPAHFDDALAVVDALNEKLILAGDSAGATLAASVTLKRREKIRGHMLIYPWLDVPGEHESYKTHAEAPVLTAQALQDFEALRLSGQPRPKTPDYFPLMGDDFNNLPPSYISTADCDPLCDEGTLYNTLHIFSGGESVLMEESGLMHGHLQARHHSARAMEAFEHICEGLKNLAAWEKPAF